MIHWSGSSLKEDGQAWVRLWTRGPGICVTTREKELFSVRKGHVRRLRLGNYTFTFVKSVPDYAHPEVL